MWVCPSNDKIGQCGFYIPLWIDLLAVYNVYLFIFYCYKKVPFSEISIFIKIYIY